MVALGGVSAVTVHQLGYWKKPYDLWTHTLEITHNNYIAEDGLAYVLLHEGRPEALSHYETAAMIAPWDPISHNAVAASLEDRGKLTDAIAEYAIALRAKPDPKLRAHVYAELGFIYRQLGDYSRAQENSLLSLKTDPEELPEMITQLSERVAQRPAPAGYFRLGSLLEEDNRIDEAKAAYGQALQLNPQFSPALRALEALHNRRPAVNWVEKVNA